MPKIPDIALTERPTPKPELGTVGYQATSGAETAPGEALMRQGAVTGNEANEIFQAFKVEQDRIDVSKAEDAMNKLNAKRMELTYGPQGFKNVNGGDAIKPDFNPGYMAKFSAAANEIAQGLDSPRQQQLFKPRGETLGTQFKEGLFVHSNTENVKYQDGVDSSTVKDAINNIGVDYKNEGGAQFERLRIEEAVKRTADRKGWSPEMTKEATFEAISKTHTTVIEQALAAGDTTFAEQYFKANRAGVDPKVSDNLAKAVEGGVQKDLSNYYRGQFITSRDDIDSLNVLEEEVLKDKRLDDTRKNILQQSIVSRRETLERRDAMKNDVALRQLKKGIEQATKITLAGYDLNPDQVMPLLDAAKGTELEGDVRQLIQTNDQMREFRKVDFRSQEIFINELEAVTRKNPTKYDVGAVPRFRSVHDTMVKEATTDLVSFGERQGLIQVKPLDLTHPENLADGMQERINQSRSLAMKYQVPLKIFTKEEDAALTAGLKNFSAKDKAAYLSTLARSTNDRQAYRSMMQQIAPDDPVTALAGLRLYATQFDGVPTGRTVAQYMLEGQELMHPLSKEDGKPIKSMMPMPSDKDLLERFSAYEGNAFAGAPETRNAVFQGAARIYAAKSDRAGDYTGKLDVKRWEESQEMATGGITGYHGKNIVLPFGMPYGDFKDGLKARVQALETAGRLPPGVTAGKLLGMPLKTVGDGRYAFPVGDAEQGDKDGKRITIDFNEPIAPVVAPKAKQITRPAPAPAPIESPPPSGNAIPISQVVSQMSPKEKARSDLETAIAERKNIKATDPKRAMKTQAIDAEIEDLKRILREANS